MLPEVKAAPAGGRLKKKSKSGDAEIGNKGLLFMCLNGDLERQFEFVQQTWVMSKNFHGLDGEVDPLLSRGGQGGRMTIPTPTGSVQRSDIPNFVRAQGGAYFFLPGLRSLRYLAQLEGAVPA